MKRARRWSMLLALVACAACGAPRASTALEGRFVIEGERSRGDFANDLALVRKADAQISELLGHPASFHFAAALVPRWDATLDLLSAQAIDSIAHELVRMKRIDPDMFAWMAPNLRRVEWDYSATDEHARYSFDAAEKTLRIVLTSGDASLVEEDFVRFAVGRAYASAQAARFAGATQSGVAPTDRAAYAQWLLDFAYGAERKAHPPKGDDDTLDVPRARVLLELLRFRESIRGQDAALEQKLDDRLVDEGEYLARARRANREIVARLPADHELLRAEAAYVGWLDRHEASLPDRARVKIAEDIRDSSDDDGTVRAFAGFDVVGHYLRVLDSWAKAGAPTKPAGDADSARQELFALVVAPVELYAGDGFGCGGPRAPVYRLMNTDAQVRQRVISAVLAKKDERVTKTVMARLLVGDITAALALWRAAEPDDAAFHATTRVVAGNVRCNGRLSAFYDALPELWKKYPRRRGLLAYTVHKFGAFMGAHTGEGFDRVFSPLTQSDFAAELAEEDEPLRELHFIWALLGRGWSRMDVVGPRLDGWISAPRYRTDTSWADGVRALANDLCDDDATADLARLHAWIDARTRAHASEIPMLERASARSAPGGCKAR